jgi:hypothetical protein
MSKRSATRLTVVLLLGAYLGGYGIARHENWIVHRAMFYTDAEHTRRVMDHAVWSGDFGTPMLAPKEATAQAAVAWLYLPIRYMETLVWRVVTPRGSEWPKRWHSRDDQAELPSEPASAGAGSEAAEPGRLSKQ